MMHINPAQITFGDKGHDGYIATRIHDERISNLVIGSKDAPLRAPFGISEPPSGAGGGAVKHKTMDLEINDDLLLGKLRALDEKVASEAVSHSPKFFGKTTDETRVRAMHQPLVSSKEYKGDTVHTVRTKVKTGHRPTAVWLQAGPNGVKPGTLDDVAPGSDVVPFVKLSSVMINNRQFGVSLYVEQLMVTNAAASSAGPSVFGDFEVV